ncbi:MAG: DUF3108 domain-containing protein [Burkholderiales bacterium]|nr:DUF3108 domain-containing protein [Burkholderiales bacterium]
MARGHARGARAWVVLGLLTLTGIAAAAPPARVEIRYELTYNGTAFAEGVEVLEHDGRDYRIRSQARGRGLFAMLNRGEVTRSSYGTVLPGRLRPHSYRDQRGDRAPETAQFDWAKRVVVVERRGQSRTLPAVDDMQDRLSFAWGFAFAPAIRDEVAVTIVDGRGATRYRYRQAGSEALTTAAGVFRTVRLVKHREGGDERSTELWLASGRAHVPVRILVIEKDGTRVDQVATAIKD